MITYIKGDATAPQCNSNKVIVHVCNNMGGWGKGFVLALSKKWSKPESVYRTQHKTNGLSLGDIQCIKVEDDIWVINMIAQKGYKKIGNEIPLQFDALEKCLQKTSEIVKTIGGTIHGPKFGSGLSGANWSQIEPLIEKHWHNIEVFIYEL